jgi:signal transduction histidine kinase/CheY-like chemotaxis protein/HPt (histidine-containing phosphotransfer) domain-containing protein
MGGLIPAAWMLMLGLALGWAAAPEPLTNMSTFKRLTPQEAAGGIPVLFRGVVTGGAPSVGELFVQDGVQSIYVRPSQAGLEVQIGDLVEVAGVSVASFSPWVDPSRVTRLGTAPLPPARPANGQDLLSPAFLESRVQVEGMVRRAVRDVRYTDPRFGGPPISLGLLVSGERVTATVWRRGLDDQLPGLVGSYIRITGVCTPVYNPQRQVVRGAIHVTAADTVQVLQPGPTNLFALPRTALGDLLKHEVLAQPHSFTHVAGVVTAVASPHSFFLQDDHHTGMRVRTQQPMGFSAGDEVSLVGLARAEQGPGDAPLDKIISRLERTLVSFTAEQGIRLGSKPLPAPIPVTAETLDAVTNRHQRLSFAATVAAVGQSLLPTDQQLTLSAGRHLIPVVAFPSPTRGKLPALGSRVQVTGVLEEVGETDAEPMNLQLHVASLGDLMVLAPPPLNYVSLLSWAVLVACLGGAAALAWAFTMRQAVRARTAALDKANRELAEASAAKGQFLAMMSHEIRTPIHAMLGFIQVLQRTSLPPPLGDIALRAAQAGRSLTRLLDDILNSSRMEAGQLLLEKHPFEVSDLLRHVDESCVETARSKGLDWRVDTGGAPAGRFLGDPMRIGQILTNLAANAIKFTSQGCVEVRATVQPMDPDRITLRLEVRDTGPGIAPDALATLFEPFVQADASIPRKYGGTGLGLAISRRLAEQMEGRLGAESTPGQGSLFWVELPLQRAQAADAPSETILSSPPGGQPLQGHTFLVVDDNSLNLDLMVLALRQEGATAVPATSGQEALDQLRREPKRFDAVLVDMQMPGMDGLETTRAIRQKLGLAHLPILAVSAGVLAEQTRAALEAGANRFVPKPIEVAQLLAALQLQMPAQAPAPVKSSFPPVPGLDTQHAAVHLNHNPEFFLRSLRRFRDEFATLPREVREAGTATQPGAVADRLHNLRGIAGAIGALPLCEAAATLENALRHADPDCGRLRAAFSHQLEALLLEIDRVANQATLPAKPD